MDINIESGVSTLVRSTLNGREIANAVSTARTIARFQKRPLTLDDIMTILGMRKEFDEGMKKM
jgi:hypothetical protein